MILEIVEGPETGRRIKLRENETITLGRTESAMEKFAQDPGMSGLHLSIGLNAGSVRMNNLSKTNGTLVNGARVDNAVLKPGDRIAAGSTIFQIIGPAPNPYPARFRVGSWGFNTIPDGWGILEGLGLTRQVQNGFAPSVTALEDSAPEEKTLAEYIAMQVDLMKSQLKDPDVQGPADARVEGSEQALLLTVRSTAQDGRRVVQRQLYALSGEGLGVLTLSALDDDAQSLNPQFAEIARGANFHKPPLPL